MKFLSTCLLPSVLFVKSKDVRDNAIANFLETRTSSLSVTGLGEEAIELFLRDYPDIVITNLDLEDMNGLEVAATIRKESPDQVIIVITVDSTVQTLQQAIDIGISKYLIKPINFDEFEKSLNRISDKVLQKKARKEQDKLFLEYKNAFDSATTITKTDQNGIITYANDEFIKMSGYTQKELIGFSHNIVRHPDTPAFVYHNMWQTLLAKKIWKGRIKNKTKCGRSYIFDATIVPILDRNNEITEFLAIRQDVTRLVELEEKEREEQDQQQLLEHQLEVTEKVNKAKESFLLIFTHELKTPLNAIINFSDYLQKEIRKTSLPNASKLTELAVQIRENGYDMLNTVTALLDLARLKSNRLIFQSSAFDLGNIVTTQIERSRSLIQNNGISITVNAPLTSVRIINDAERIRQIFSNLLSNAIKYGGNKILISFDQEGDYFWLRIEDNGKGLKNTEAIFELFEQSEDNDITRSAKGTGIGLYFVKTFCYYLGLEVSAGRSSALRGASFTIRGPILFHPKGTE